MNSGCPSLTLGAPKCFTRTLKVFLTWDCKLDSLNLLQQCVTNNVSVLFSEHVKTLLLGVTSTRESPGLDSVLCSPGVFSPFFVHQLPESESVPALMLSRDSVPLSLSVCLSLLKGFALYLLKTMESIMWERNELFYRNTWQSLPGIKLWSPTDPENKQYSKQHCLLRRLSSKLMVDMHFYETSPFIFVAFSKVLLLEHMCITLGEGHGRVCNIRI